MPRLTESTRLARRDAIADAALRVFGERGVAHTSTADIIEELGGSAGGVYSHFASKAELVRYIAERMLADGLPALEGSAGPPRDPAAVLQAALTEVAAAAPPGVLVQLWGEAAVDPEIRDVVLDTLARVEASLQAAILPWAREQPGEPRARAVRTARAMRVIAQGSIVHASLFGRATSTRGIADLLDALVAEQRIGAPGSEDRG